MELSLENIVGLDFTDETKKHCVSTINLDNKDSAQHAVGILADIFGLTLTGVLLQVRLQHVSAALLTLADMCQQGINKLTLAGVIRNQSHYLKIPACNISKMQLFFLYKDKEVGKPTQNKIISQNLCILLTSEVLLNFKRQINDFKIVEALKLKPKIVLSRTVLAFIEKL